MQSNRHCQSGRRCWQWKVSVYGKLRKVFDTEIPRSVRAAEISAEGKSIYAHDPHGKVSEAYRSLTGEVLKLEKQREKHKSDLSR